MSNEDNFAHIIIHINKEQPSVVVEMANMEGTDTLQVLGALEQAKMTISQNQTSNYAVSKDQMENAH